MNFSTGFWLFARLTGLAYFSAFISLYFQISGLIGTDGILPAQAMISEGWKVFGPGAPWMIPSLAWLFGASNFSLHFIAMIGLLSSLALTFGLLRPVSAALAWLCWLSFVVS